MKQHNKPSAKFASLYILFLLVSAIALPFSTSWAQQVESGIGNNQKREPLPEGFTEDWLNSLRDDEGNRIYLTKDDDEPENEGDAFQRTIFNSPDPGSLHGYSVSSAGDVNGDGYDDIIIGAIESSNTGRAYIYFGGVIMDNVADVILSGEATSNNFGYSVSSAGDVNGDGYSDVIVGAYSYSLSVGRAYIYFGGASMNNVADVMMTGEATNSNFGYSVSSAGDVNGDGYSDAIVGTFGYSANRGRTYIFFGGASMNNVADLTITGATIGNNLGISVSHAGDINGDGYDDVIVGATGGTGRAYIFFGGASMDTIADVTMTGEATGQAFGMSVSYAGDINGDGYNDVIVGAHQYSGSRGRSYIFLGGATMDSIPDLIMTGEASGYSFGRSVSFAGDVNGDGYSDVIVGANGYSFNTGIAYIFFGGSSMNDVADDIIIGEDMGNFFGRSVSYAGDVNGNGYSDIVVGAYGYSSNMGRAYLYDYFMSNEINYNLQATGETADERFGFSVSSAGDVNGDGYADIIVGAYGYSGNTGRAYIFFGGPLMNNVADVTMTGELGNDRYGFSVSSAGDVNGDGYDDVIVGTFLQRNKIYIYFGGASMNDVADLTISGPAFSSFGRSVSSAGDVNGDGYSDVIVGAIGGSGRTYIFLGGASMDTIADVIMTGEATGSAFGISVSYAGDVNGDGYDDVIVGAYQYSGSRGRAYIFLGGATMDSIADLIMSGEATGINFGESVSSAGDVNGDGYSDIVIGAQMYSFSTGRAYIYYGGKSMDTVSDVTMTGEAMNSKFGKSVSSAGDVNGDGYDDVIVGANIAGRTFIYLGGASMDSGVDIFMTEEFVGDSFGNSVSGAGDVNGDGYPDFIVGADFYSSGRGRAYIFTGSAISANPILNYVKDVPDDQGGKVNLKWAKSSLEAYGSGNVHKYLVYRSPPPALNEGFKWEKIAEINAANNSFYYYEASTLQDSVSTYFQIKAKNTTTGKTWSSNIMYGSSIANIAPNITLNLTAFIQGFYDPSSDLQVSDTVTIQLRNSASPHAVADVSKAVIGTNGTAEISFTSASPGNYFIAFKHRNSIETWSQAPVAMSNTVAASYNFTTSVSQAYGSNLIQINNIPVRFGIYNGDVDQDGTVDASDLSLIDNDAANFNSGYLPTDINGDDFVDGTDFAIADNNAANFISVIEP